MFIEINGKVIEELNLTFLKTEFPKYKHLFKEPLQFKLAPHFWKKDPDKDWRPGGNPESFVPRLYRIPTKYTKTSADGQAITVQYYKNKRPNPKIPGAIIYDPKAEFFNKGEYTIDVNSNGTFSKPNLALAYLFLSHPWFNSTFILEDGHAINKLENEKSEREFKAMKLLYDHEDKKYIRDKDLVQVAREMGIASVTGKDPDWIRRQLYLKAKSNPDKFAEYEGTKEGRLTAMIGECEDYKIITYVNGEKMWYATALIEEPGVIAKRVQDSKPITGATKATTAVPELVNWLITIDPNNVMSKLENLLAEEKLRVERISNETGADEDTVRLGIQLQKKVSKAVSKV